MSLHINKFIDLIKAQESRGGRDITMSLKDAKDLQDIAYLEPLYKDGKAMFEAGRYRTAYESLNKVLDRKDTYKDAKELKAKALEKGTITVAILPFNNGTRVNGVETSMAA